VENLEEDALNLKKDADSIKEMIYPRAMREDLLPLKAAVLFLKINSHYFIDLFHTTHKKFI